MRIALVEAFYTGSHKQWADGFQENSSHQIDLYTLPGRFWKWRMRGAAITLADQLVKSGVSYDYILVTDIIDLPLFKACLIKSGVNCPVFLYFHENQITYPWSENDQDVALKRDHHYGFINFISALLADKVFFNSKYHKNSFIESLPEFLNRFPDYNESERVGGIEQKSEVLPLAVDLSFFNRYKHDEKTDIPLILWNHRWEYDKNPEGFFNILFQLKEEGFRFKLVVIGESHKEYPDIFNIAKEKLANEIVCWGYQESFEDYAYWLWKADIMPVCSYQDFFGISVVEAIYCNTIPLVPNRLAYPDYVNEDNIWADEKELINKIKNYKRISLPDVSKYDWKKGIAIYDGIFRK